ncbi:MAG TPA: carbohydrate binding domain-containing protein [Candidatus Omnitrophota bacterium]|nr:carbohydrate binding domain-containing protein [Candidatus Omnitrophota bacterium]
MSKPLVVSLSFFVLICVIFLIVVIPKITGSITPAPTEIDAVPAESILSAANAVISDPVIPDPVVPAPAAEVVPVSPSNQLVIADFDTGDKPNNLGGDFGAWNKDPDDTTQGSTISFEIDDALGDSSGYSLKLDYDVESENPAYNGFWMKLNELDASEYNTVSFYVRGEGLNNYTRRIKIEIKDSSNMTAPYIISGITESWQKIQVPFERFRKIQNWSSLGEFVVVFDDMNSEPEQGTILIDQIAFEKR